MFAADVTDSWGFRASMMPLTAALVTIFTGILVAAAVVTTILALTCGGSLLLLRMGCRYLGHRQYRRSHAIVAVPAALIVVFTAVCASTVLRVLPLLPVRSKQDHCLQLRQRIRHQVSLCAETEHAAILQAHCKQGRRLVLKPTGLKQLEKVGVHGGHCVST